MRLNGFDMLAPKPDSTEHYQRELGQRLQASFDDDPPDPAVAWVLVNLDRYSEGLCGHPVVRDPSGRAVAVVASTKNILGHHFATSKQSLRRRLRCAHLGPDLANQPVHTALTANLLDPAYVPIVCGSLDQWCRASDALKNPVAHGHSTHRTQQSRCGPTSAQTSLGQRNHPNSDPDH